MLAVPHQPDGTADPVISVAVRRTVPLAAESIMKMAVNCCFDCYPNRAVMITAITATITAASVTAVKPQAIAFVAPPPSLPH